MEETVKEQKILIKELKETIEEDIKCKDKVGQKYHEALLEACENWLKVLENR